LSVVTIGEINVFYLLSSSEMFARQMSLVSPQCLDMFIF
jgi:hypothetical protein